MYRNHWKRLLCLALVLTLLMSISAVLAAPYDPGNTENTYDQTENPFTPSIDTDLSYESYACLGDSIAAGFGDYDYYPDDGCPIPISREPRPMPRTSSSATTTD